MRLLEVVVGALGVLLALVAFTAFCVVWARVFIWLMDVTA